MQKITWLHAHFDRVEECNSMAFIPLPANMFWLENHFPTLQKHGAWTGTGFVCSDDLPLSDDEDEEQAAFNFICKHFVWDCSFSLVLVLGSLFWLHSRAGTRSHSTGLIWQACRLRQGDKGMQLGFFSTWSMHLPHLTTLRIYGLEWYTKCGREMFMAGREGSLFPFSIRSQSTTERRKGFGRWYFGLPLCRCLVWNQDPALVWNRHRLRFSRRFAAIWRGRWRSGESWHRLI